MNNAHGWYYQARPCQHCNTEFRPQRYDAKYCKPACRVGAHKKRARNKAADAVLPTLSAEVTVILDAMGGRVSDAAKAGAADAIARWALLRVGQGQLF